MGRRYLGERIRQRVPESIGAESGHCCFGTFTADARSPRSCGGAISIAYTLSVLIFSRLTKHSMALPGAPELASARRYTYGALLLDSWISILRAIKEPAFTIPYLRYLNYYLYIRHSLGVGRCWERGELHALDIEHLGSIGYGAASACERWHCWVSQHGVGMSVKRSKGHARRKRAL